MNEPNFRDAVSGYKDSADPTPDQLQYVLALAGGPEDIAHLLSVTGINETDRRFPIVSKRAAELGRQS